VNVVADDNGDVDFRGPAVYGRRGDRFLYLTWGDLTDDERFEMFRRAKLMLNHINPGLVSRARRHQAATRWHDQAPRRVRGTSMRTSRSA